MIRSVILQTTLLLSLTTPALAQMEMPPMSEAEQQAAAADYQKYCALCHGADRAGYANDDAPSLRSRSLFESGFPYHIAMAISYGRRGTPMGGYSQEVGGPLDEQQLQRLVTWLKDQVGVAGDEPFPSVVEGDVELGEKLFARECAVCHGVNGEGQRGPAIGNPAMLSVTSDNFLRYAIQNGRDGTEMPAFGKILEPHEIDSLTAFLRSRAAGWDNATPEWREPPTVDHWILNPESPPPAFDPEDGLYVKAADLFQALEDKRRLVLLDTRVPSMWQMAHIRGSVPIPYYHEDMEDVAENLPRDGTWIVTYCECPRAAAEHVNRKLRAQGFANTAVLWEGIQGWVALGYPVSVGKIPQEATEP